MKRLSLIKSGIALMLLVLAGTTTAENKNSSKETSPSTSVTASENTDGISSPQNAISVSEPSLSFVADSEMADSEMAEANNIVKSSGVELKTTLRGRGVDRFGDNIDTYSRDF